MRKIFVKSIIFFAILLFFVIKPNSTLASGSDQIKTPTVINADLKNIHAKWGRPIIVGLTEKETDVLVYIDSNFSGIANINKGKETDNFYYQPVEALKTGTHTVEVIAKSKFSLKLSYISKKYTVIVESVSAPTVVFPSENSFFSNTKPNITGLTHSGTRVLVYIDDVYNGKTEVLYDKSGVANFKYQPFLNLNTGTHKYYLITESKFGEKSQKSKVVSFKIEKEYPAPTIYKPVVNKKTSHNKPFIVGLAKNNSKVKVYIDKKLDGEFVVNNHISGTANFAYSPSKALTSGNHLIYTTAIDNNGKESKQSNKIFYKIESLLTPTISKQAEVEQKEVITDKINKEEIDNNKETKNNTENKDNKKETVEKPNSEKNISTTTDAIINDILNTEKSTNTEETGLVDEKQNNQGDLKWNLVIFILFLMAVIGWIFWVNKELIKERGQKQEENDQKDKLDF